MKERLRTTGQAVGQRARAVLRPAAARGVAVEAAWFASHVVRYPLGVARERTRPHQENYRLDDLPPLHRGLVIGDVEAAGTPILLVHGLVDNRSIFAKLRRSLLRRGFGRVVTINLPVLTHDVPRAARRLAGQVEALCTDTGYERIHVVGHSLGGLVARYYVQCLGGDARVHTLVTLGTPHSGTLAAHLLPRGAVGQLRPGSEVIRQLAGPAPGCRTRFLAFSSDLDQLIVPADNARIDHPDLIARNVRVHGIGHMSLPFDGRVVHEIAATLAYLAPEGHTVTEGVTSIDAKQDRTSDARVFTSSRSADFHSDTPGMGSDLSAPAPPA